MKVLIKQAPCEIHGKLYLCLKGKVSCNSAEEKVITNALSKSRELRDVKRIFDYIHIDNLMRVVFRTQGEFYNTIKPKGYQDHNRNFHVSDYDFNGSCTGFVEWSRTFFNTDSLTRPYKYLSKSTLILISNAIKKRLYERVNNLNEAIIVQDNISFLNNDPNNFKGLSKFTAPTIFNDGSNILVTSDGAYSIGIKKIDGIKNLRDASAAIYKELESSFQIQLKQKIKVFETQIEKLIADADRASQEGFIQGLETFKSVYQNGWKPSKRMTGYLEYRKVINVNRIKYKDKVYDIPDNFDTSKIKINTLYIPIKPVVVQAFANRKGTFHPNVNYSSLEYGKFCNVCIGSLKGKDLSTVAENLPKILETVNLDSAYDNYATDEMIHLYNDLPSDIEENRLEVFSA